MKIFFTSDTHFNHANIIKYCNRPFLRKGDLIGDGDIAKRIWQSEKIKRNRCDLMNKTLIDNWNKIVGKNDIIYHLGDFGFLNVEEYVDYINKLNGHIVLFKGNHDVKNKVKSYLTKSMMEFGAKEIFAQHHPPEIIPKCDFVICGHIHNNWKHKIYKNNPNIPVINVGIDVWDYKPVSVNSLLKYYGLIVNGLVDKMGKRL